MICHVNLRSAIFSADPGPQKTCRCLTQTLSNTLITTMWEEDVEQIKKFDELLLLLY